MTTGNNSFPGSSSLPEHILGRLLGSTRPGLAIYDPAVLVRPEQLVAAIGNFVLQMWELPVEQLPNAMSATEAVIRAERLVAAGRVDSTRFDLPYQSISPQRLLDSAQRLLPDPPECPVAVHGNLRCTALELLDGSISSWPEPDEGGIGDPYRDLAGLSRDLARLIGAGAVGALFSSVALERPEPVRLEFWVMIGQLLEAGGAVLDPPAHAPLPHAPLPHTPPAHTPQSDSSPAPSP